MSRYLIKLVRDDLAKVESSCDGHELRFWCVSRTRHLRLLKGKLLEEAGEYLTAEDESEALGELADLLELIETLAKLDLGVTRNELYAAKRAKLRERGGFMRGTAMFSRPPDHPSPEGSER